MPNGLILIVDDDQAVRDATARLLRRASYSSKTYESGDHFLAEPLPDGVTCVLLDVRMPGTDGIGVLRLLESRGTMPPVIVITGHGDIPLAVEAMRQGASDFLEKPYAPERLFQAIERAIGDWRGRPEPRLVDPEAKAVLDRLTKVPIDIEPRFVTAEKLLQERRAP